MRPPRRRQPRRWISALLDDQTAHTRPPPGHFQSFLRTERSGRRRPLADARRARPHHHPARRRLARRGSRGAHRHAAGALAASDLHGRRGPGTDGDHLLLAAALRRCRRRRDGLPATTTFDVLLPAAASGLLLLPYLPWLPDAPPILRLLAGPGRALVWFTIVALIARGFWRGLPGRARLAEASPRVVAAVLFVVGTLICGATASVFARTILLPGGDEPHYLVIAQSLWRDGDLKIENNHTRGDYHEYFEGDLRPHYLRRGTDREIYSIHPIGVSVLLTPVYAIGGYTLVVWAMAAMASAAGALAWLLAYRTSGSRTAATMAWLACCVNGPWVFNSFAVYPEVPAALAVMGAWLAMSGRMYQSIQRRGRQRHVAALDAVRRGHRDAAVVQHEIRADGGRDHRDRARPLVVAGNLSEEQPLRDHLVGCPADADRHQPGRLVRRSSTPSGARSRPRRRMDRSAKRGCEYLPAGGPGLLFDQNTA